MHTRLTSRIIGPFVLVAIGLLAGCEGVPSDVHIDGTIDYAGCEDGLPWDPPFATYQQTNNGDGLIRFQSTPGAVRDDDSFVMVIHDAQALSGRLGEALSVVPSGEDGDVQATLALNTSCPSMRSIPTTTRGTVTFSRFSGAFETMIVGEFELELFDARDGTVISADLSGEFNFEVSRYQPYQTFN